MMSVDYVFYSKNLTHFPDLMNSWQINILEYVSVLFIDVDLDQEWGEIRCQFLLLGGSIGPRYVLKLLISEKTQNC